MQAYSSTQRAQAASSPSFASFSSASSAGECNATNTTDATAPPLPPPPYFGTHAVDHAVAGVGAGITATVCMNPLDLIKVKFQVDTRPVRPLSLSFPSLSLTHVLTGGRVGREIAQSLSGIVREHGWTGLYRGLGPNVIGNSTSWGLYFLWYTMIKEAMSNGQLSLASASSSAPVKLSASQHLLAASVSGAATALLTNPIWVVKTRMFATPPPPRRSSQCATIITPRSMQHYRNTLDGLVSIYRNEGIRGWYKGGGLALVGVSNGAIQFTAYEQLKKWRSRVAMRRNLRQSGPHAATAQDDKLIPEGGVKLSNTEYILLSGASKIAAIFLTYPYQVVRSRIQNFPVASSPTFTTTAASYTSIPDCIRKTYTHEGGLRAFYKGLTANCVRVLPGTCVTFVVYEQIAWALKGAAADRTAAAQRASRAAPAGNTAGTDIDIDG
ncbi:mitochondrial carrier [Tilletiaria anomala UBC 951]|uniref:Mitochondrial carrier n=1 Tax=Tilletiaria anomala (strain ATCC 24038 / CBS 436.72 / UBC 951) TaxID=1037660 RepID=A0A066WFN8_TILAU|nr:mitochondrial carrier [Tilletiaria anomala UBC 951]KDN52616.1 mitochondrial carrier [Tilletiaria anomala UBC 951]